METTISPENLWHIILASIIFGCVIVRVIIKKIGNRHSRATASAAIRRNFDFFQY